MVNRQVRKIVELLYIGFVKILLYQVHFAFRYYFLIIHLILLRHPKFDYYQNRTAWDVVRAARERRFGVGGGGGQDSRSLAGGGALSVVRLLCSGKTAAAAASAIVCGDGGTVVALEAGWQRVPSGLAPFDAISIQLFRSSFTRRTRTNGVYHRRCRHLSRSWSIPLSFD